MSRPVTLPEPVTPAGRAGLAALLKAPARAVVALDFDGTLAPIVTDPSASAPVAGARGALERLAGQVRTLAIISGRGAQVVVDLGGFDQLRPLVVLGHYGLERWSDGVLSAPEPMPGVAVARRDVPALVEGRGEIEDKGHSLAVHTRRAADPQGALTALAAPLRALAARTGLVVEPGRLVLELRPPGVDKGSALRQLVNERDADALLYAGDDLGDLAAFDAVAALRDQGIPGVTVCSATAEAVPAVQERADLVVDGPAGIVALLDALGTRIAAGPG